MKGAWLAQVKKGNDAHFYWNWVKRNCPALTPECKRRGYLLPNDVAVAAYTAGPFTVVDFVGPDGAITEGAIESRLLDKIDTPNPAVQDWVGHWESTDEEDIVISRTRSAAVLAFLGHATWGAHDPEKVKNGGINLGSFAAYVMPVAEWGGFVEDLEAEGERGFKLPAIAAQKSLGTDWVHTFPKDDQIGKCQASFRLLGPYLLTYTPADGCGGLNVTFTGVYRRMTPHHS